MRPAQSNWRRQHAAERTLRRRWFVLHGEKGVAVDRPEGRRDRRHARNHGPDLGRVAAIRQEGGRWVVVMDKGMTIRER